MWKAIAPLDAVKVYLLLTLHHLWASGRYGRGRSLFTTSMLSPAPLEVYTLCNSANRLIEKINGDGCQLGN